VPGDWLQIAVARAGDGPLVGDCALAPQAHEARTVEIGFTIAPEHQGRGYAREAVSLLLRYLFGQLGKHRVTASCDSRNAPSVRVLETVGMRREGHLAGARGPRVNGPTTFSSRSSDGTGRSRRLAGPCRRRSEAPTSPVRQAGPQAEQQVCSAGATTPRGTRSFLIIFLAGIY
jgi:hypothetical protein